MASRLLHILAPLAALTAFGLVSCQASSEPEESVKPGINEPFLDASDEDIEKFVNIFEGESREISTARKEIVAALNIQPGMDLGDIGAGTGLFEPQFQKEVGADGTVFAVDLSPKMLEYLRNRVVEEKLDRVVVMSCTETDCGLPENSVDMIFICDTYHHFEFPQTTLGTLKRALRPGGTLAIVDFERVPGVSREWVLNHVRAGKEETRNEIEAAGFEFLAEPKVDGLEENYLILFRRP